MSEISDLSVGQRDRLCRGKAAALWELIAIMPEPYRHNILFELVKIWVERTPPDQLDDLAADLRGRAFCAEEQAGKSS
ncbi:MAG: hypothetical protein L3J67_13400 [Hyphomicrobiaceae bacterium]|nr:hypothetical protein [Hyphomicrobiaceae bacterium]